MRSGALVWVLVLIGCAPKAARFDAPDELDFGDVEVGRESAQTLVITNLSDVDDTVTFSAPAGFTVTPSVAVLARGARLEVVVSTTASDLGPQESALTVAARDFEKQVLLRVRGTGARLEVSDSLSLPPIALLNFASVGSTSGVLRVRNVGTAGSTLKFAMPDSDDPALCVGACGSSAIASVDAGQFVELPVSLTSGADQNRARTLTFHSNDPLEPVRQVRVLVLIAKVSSCLFFAPSVISVGPNGAVVRLQHYGTSPCLLRATDLEVVPTDSLRFEDTVFFPRILQPGEALTRVLKPTLPPRFLNGVLRLEFEGGTNEVALRPTGNPNPCLALVPPSLEFGTLAGAGVCASAPRNVVVYNQCAEPLVLTAAATTTPDFTISQFVPGVEVHAGGPPAVISVRFTPTASGVLDGSLSLSTADSQVLVPLSGVATPPPRQTDTFRADALPASRTLFIIDTSPSFATERARVRGEVESMLSGVASSCADLNVAFAPAEGAGSVAFSPNDGGAAWTSSRQPDFVGRALSAFDALPASSETESCVGPAAELLAAIPDAGIFSALCITDALEQTPDAGGALAALRAHSSNVSWNAVTGTSTSTCAVEAHDDDLVHRALTTATGGTRSDVCGAFHLDFATGGFECGFRTLFFLTAVPRGMIEARIDGRLVPSSGWVYDAAQNAVNFEPRFAPQPGATLEITYFRDCAP